MPGVPNQETAHEALVRVCGEIDNSGSGGTPEDYAFIRAILQDVVVDAMFQTHDKHRTPMEPADHNATATVNELLDQLDRQADMRNPDMRALFEILADADMQAVLLAHDDIARKSFEPVVYQTDSEPLPKHVMPYSHHAEPPREINNDGRMKIIGMRKIPGEPLGITVGNDEDGDPNELIVVRIADNSITAREGLINVGDVIAEVNNVPVSTAEQLGDAIRRSGPDIKFKVIPASVRVNKRAEPKRYLKAHFSYDPFNDSRLSAPQTGLAFREEDILAIIKDTDRNWWECENIRTRQTGNIPSPSFEERRQISQPAPDKTKSSLLCGLGKNKKKKKAITTAPPSNKPDTPTVLYEEVIRVKPFRHRCLVLVGAQGIGRRSIKNRLIQMKPMEFGAPTPNTSRAMREGEVPGRNYHFLSRGEMESDIKSGKYLEYGELNGNYYGTSLAALTIVIDSGRTCIIDPKSAALSKLRTVDWMPYVVFVKPTDSAKLKQMNEQAINDGVDTQRKSDEEIRRILDETQRIHRQYIHFCDTSIPYNDFQSACNKILQLLEQADTSPQWVPSAWNSATEQIPFTD